MSKYFKYLFKRNIKPFVAVCILLIIVLITLSLYNLQEFGGKIYKTNLVELSAISIIIPIISLLLGLYIRYPFLNKTSIDTYLSLNISKHKLVLARYLISIVVICLLSFVGVITCLLLTLKYDVGNLGYQYFFLYLILIIFVAIIILTISSSVLMLSTNIVDSICYMIYTLLLPIIILLFICCFNSEIKIPLYSLIYDLTMYCEKSIFYKLNKPLIYKNYETLKYLIPNNLNIIDVPIYILTAILMVLSYFSLRGYKAEDAEDINTTKFNYLIPLSITYFIIMFSVYMNLFVDYFVYYILGIIAYFITTIFFNRKLKISKKEIIIMITITVLAIVSSNIMRRILC